MEHLPLSVILKLGTAIPFGIDDERNDLPVGGEGAKHSHGRGIINGISGRGSQV